MSNLEHSGERSPVDLTLFGAGFFALLFSLAGVVLASPWLAIGAGLVALVSIGSFWVRSLL